MLLTREMVHSHSPVALRGHLPACISLQETKAPMAPQNLHEIYQGDCPQEAQCCIYSSQ